MVQTKAQRSEAAKKAARTRKRNANLKASGATKTAVKRKRTVAAKKRTTKTALKKRSVKRTTARKLGIKSKGKRQ